MGDDREHLPGRTEGPTPHGGAHALAYRDGSGRIREIVEFDARGEEIHRTYAADDDVAGDVVVLDAQGNPLPLEFDGLGRAGGD